MQYLLVAVFVLGCLALGYCPLLPPHYNPLVMLVAVLAVAVSGLALALS